MTTNGGSNSGRGSGFSGREHPRPIAYALFSGGGGFHLGLEVAGFDVVVATDIEATAMLTHQRNWPSVPFIRGDIRTITGEQLREAAGGLKPDLVFGGPPCQGFSTLGDKFSSDPRNSLFLAFARIVQELQPQCVLFENVRAMVTMYGGQYGDYVVRTFADLGYRVFEKVLNAADYGVPQIRHRVFFFGTRSDAAFAFPAATHGKGKDLKPYECVGRWIGDLAKRGEEVPNNLKLDHGEIVVARYKLIPEGGRLPGPSELPKRLRRGNFGNTYKRLHRRRPSLTLVPGNNAFPVHPTLNRSLTPREAARLQTFPDSYVFEGDRRRQCILIGNAVPPKLALALGLQIRRHLQGRIAQKRAEEPVQRPHELRTLNSLLPSKRLEGLPPSSGFVDLFSGAGGFTLGFARAGWRPVLSVDADETVAKTHCANFAGVPFVRADLSSSEVLREIAGRLQGQEVGVVVGGPPCQGFSIFGNRRFVNTRRYKPRSDPRNALVFAFVDLVKTVQPRWFVMENVSGLKTLDGGLFLKELMGQFRAAGYENTEPRILNAADYGVPQLRKRLVLIGNRTGHIIPWPKRKFFAEPQEWQKRYRTVGEVLVDLADERSYARQTSHVPMKHKPLLVERYKLIPEGERLNTSALPNHLRKGYRTDEVKNYSHVFKRLHRDKPASTMVPGHNAFPIHPWLDRALTVREAARIQTFPDEFVFCGSRQEQCIQVGNAFPVLLAEMIGNNLRKAEVNGWFPDTMPPSARYALVEQTPEQAELFL